MLGVIMHIILNLLSAGETSVFPVAAGIPSEMVSTTTETSTDSVAAPVLTFDIDEVDMGDIISGEIKSKVVNFRNTGNSPLIIKRVFTDCGCTVASYTEGEIPPGGEGRLTVKFMSRGRSPGSFRKVVRIRSNSPGSRTLLFVKGRVVLPTRK